MIFLIWKTSTYQSLVGSVVIGVKLGMKDHNSIPAIATGRELKPLHVKIDPKSN
jgi:hypothetical protein